MSNKTYEVAFRLAAAVDGKFNSAFMSAADKMSALHTKTVALKASMNNIDRMYGQGALTAAEYGRALAKAGAELERNEKLQKRMAAAQKLEDKAGRMQKSSASGLAASVAAGAVIAAPVLAFANAEQSATALKASMMDSTGSAGNHFAQINKLAVDLGNRLPGTTSDFHDLFRVMLQNGIQAEQILGGVGKAAAYLGVQLKIPYEEAGKMAAQMQKSTGTADGDMMSFMDTVQRLTNLGVKVDDLNQAFSKFGPTMTTLGAKGLEGAKSYGALLAMLTQVGMEGGSAGNALGKVFRAGFDAKKIGKANDDLKEFGLSLNFTNAQGEYAGLNNFFAQIEKLKALNSTQRVGVIKELFGDDAEVLQTVNILLENGRAGYEALNAKIAKQASLERRVTEQLGTMTNVMESLTGTITNLAAAIGGPLAGKLSPLADSANSFIGDTLMPWAEKNSELIGSVSALAASAVTLSASWYALSFAGSTVLSPLISFTRWMFLSQVATDGTVIASKASVAWAYIEMAGLYAKAGVLKVVTAAQWLWNAAMSANPIGLLITGIAALVAAGVLLYQNWDKVREFMATLWDSPAFAVIAFVSGPIGWAIAAGVGLIANWESVKSWFTLLWDDPAAALTAFADMIMGKFGTALAWIEEKYTNLKNLFSGGLGGSVTVAGGSVDVASNAAGGIYGQGAFLTTFAEDSDEAAIPLDGSSRAVSLWQQAGQMLGVGGAVSISAPYHVEINVGAGSNVADIQQVLEDERSKFARMLNDALHESRRLSFD